MVAPAGDSLVVLALQITKKEQFDIIPMLFEGPRVYLARAGKMIDRARAFLLAVEKERGRDEYTVENLRRFFGIIRTGAEFWQLNSLAGPSRVAENYLRRVLDRKIDVTPECADTLFDTLRTLEKLVEQATYSLAESVGRDSCDGADDLPERILPGDRGEL